MKNNIQSKTDKKIPLIETEIKVKHKTEGWTGTLKVENMQPKYYGSHRQGFTAEVVLFQDAYKPDGEYVEDPDIELEELEIL